MGKIPLASGAYDAPTSGLPSRQCLNAFPEKSRTSPDGEIQIVTRWGSLKLPDWASNARGYAPLDLGGTPKIIAVVGATIKTYDPATGTVATIPGTIAGTDRVVFAFTEVEIGILGNGAFYVGTASQMRDATDGVTTSATLSIGSTVANVASAAFTYRINGTNYSKGAVAAGTAPGNDVVPISTFGAVAFDINAAGTITAIEAPANATGYATAILAAAALPVPADAYIRMGYVTASKSDGSFTFGATALNAANTTVAYTSTATNTAFSSLLSDHDQTVFINLMSIGQRFVLQYGSRFAFTAVLDGATTTALNYYTAEYAPDGLVGGVILGLKMMHMGRSTIEPWEETGDATDPYRRSLSQEMPIGLRARDSVKIVDGSMYWVDQHNQPRRTGNAVMPDTIGGPDVSRALAATDTGDILGFALEFEGHAMYGLRLPTECPLYDANYDEWVRFKTNLTDTWRYGFALRVSGSIFLGDAEGVGFAKMHPDYKSDHMGDADTMGTEIVVLVSGFVLTDRVRRMGPLRIEGAKGIGLANGQGSDPQIQMRTSKKGANDYTPWRSRTAGAQGARATRIIFNQMGLVHPPGMEIQLSWSDPVGQIITSLNEDAA